MSLSVRLLLLVVLAVVPAVFIEIYGEFELRSARQGEIREEALRLTRLVAAEQTRIGEGTRQLLNAFGEVVEQNAGDRAACDEAARRIARQIQGYTNIGAATLDGRTTCSAVPVPPGFDMRANPVFPLVKPDTDLAVGTYLIGRLTHTPILTYAVPQRNARGEMVGVAFAAINLDWLARHFADRFNSPNLTLLMADREGTILVRLPDPEGWIGKPVGERYMPWLAASSDGVEDVPGVDGIERVIAYSPLAAEPKGLYVGVGLSKTPLFAPIDAATRQTALLIGFGFALALLAAWLGGDVFIRRPINRLLAAARRWQDGDYGARVRLTDRTSEIGKLGTAFDEMADALQRRDGERRAAEDALSRLNANLEQRVHAEIAEREKVQAALLQSQKIEAVGQLTSGVAHDFNNLLAAVLGNLELLRRRVVEPRAVQLIDGAARAATRGAKLTEQLLLFSRHHHLEPAPFDANEMILSMGELLPRTIGPTVRISRSLARDLWPAMADPSQLEVALLNLVINARDAMPLGGTLLLETANLPKGHPRLPSELAGDFVMIAVSDSGTGMTPEVKARAFEPFFTTKEVGKGTGLGLSMVYGVAKQSGGAVAIESTVGKGTTVAIFLPRAARAALPSTIEPIAESSLAEIAPGTAGVVLVVDDDHDVREVTVAALTDAGFDTHAIDTGHAALDMLGRDVPIDLMILDYAMPGLSGADVARRARQMRPALPIMLVTGYAEAGFTTDLPPNVQLLKKPFRVAELLARVRSNLAAGDASADSNVRPLRTGKT